MVHVALLARLEAKPGKEDEVAQLLKSALPSPPRRPERQMGKEEGLQRVPVGPGRDELIPLLLLADDSESQVRSYYQQGELFVLRADDGEVMGMALAIPESNRDVELKAVAVAPELHGRGVGQRMMALVLAELRLAGVRHVTVGTSSSGIGQLAFYQKIGFRLWKIERDFFSDERGYVAGIEENGIPLRDLVWMDQEL
jgi:ribosomal protein S18 acetylase RimI-like enzyme